MTDGQGKRESVGFVLVFGNFFHEDMPWTPLTFAWPVGTAVWEGLVFVSTGHIRQRVSELDRMEISRTDPSQLIVDIEVNTTRASLM